MQKLNVTIKRIFILLLVMTVFTISHVRATEPEPEIEPVTFGDVNGDGEVSVTDIFKLKRHIVMIEKLDDTAISRADTNKDGQITTTDLLFVKKLFVGLTEKTEDSVDFTTAFLKLENGKENMIYSPLSIKYALSMLNEGADGNTKIQIEKIIKGLNFTKYNSIGDVLSFANGMFIRDTFKDYVKEEYVNKLSSEYNAEIKYDPFTSPANVNKWIEDKTLGIIKNLLTKDDINEKTVMALINALAINMEWDSKFECKNTEGRDFKLLDGTTMTATTMYKKSSYDDISYYIDDNVTALTMDLKKYEDTQLEFMAIMPNNEELPDFIDNFSSKTVDNISEKLIKASKTEAGLKIYIPKFAYDYRLNLKDDLIELGIVDAFDSLKADFSKISDEEIYVSKAIHKADIEFTEEGTKAAAVTVILMEISAAIPLEATPKEPITVKFDKPFLYVIRDKETGEVWFVGTVYKPNNWEDDKTNYEQPGGNLDESN